MQTPEFSGKARLALTGKRGKDQIVAMLTALSGLFEKGFNIDFNVLHTQMPYKLTMTDIPTYPFQRVHNYPAFIANRHRLLGFGLAVESSKVPAPQFAIDQAIYDFLDLHRIEGRRVLPGAAMVDFFARTAETKTLKSFRFHVPLVLESPTMEVRAEIDEKGFCQLLLQDGDTETKICSGGVGNKSSPPASKLNSSHSLPIQTMPKGEIYECFKNVQFGDLFRTVQGIKFWDTHADGDIKVERTSNPSHDRIRKIDACLHMFGALSSRLAPPMDEDKGAYLPTSLVDFALHSDDIPYNFTCRYYLPLEIGRGARTLSASFEVFADTGGLLLSCKKYSVAWVPRGIVHKEQGIVPLKPWYRRTWVDQPLSRQELSVPTFALAQILYLGSSTSSRIFSSLSACASDVTSLLLYETVSDQSRIVSVLSAMQGRNVVLVADFTEANYYPDSNEFGAMPVQILSFLKALQKSKLEISSFVSITSLSAPVEEGRALLSGAKPAARSLVGAVAQGLLMAFRKETNSHIMTWCLDLPDLDNLSQDRIDEIVIGEIHARQNGRFSDAIVSYREDASKESICRFVPVLDPIDLDSTNLPSGTTVIIGLDSIGIRLATALVEAGVRQVIFLDGGREESDEVRGLCALLMPLTGYVGPEYNQQSFH